MTPNENCIIEAASLLDDIASGTLTQGDFYLYLEHAGLRAVELCKFVMRENLHEQSRDYIQIMFAAVCLKNICTATDNDVVKYELSMAKMHSENLYRIGECMKDGTQQ